MFESFIAVTSVVTEVAGAFIITTLSVAGAVGLMAFMCLTVAAGIARFAVWITR